MIIIYRVTRTVPVYSVQLQWEQDERGCATQRSRGRRVCSPRSSTRWRLLREKPQEYKKDSFRRGDKNYDIITKDNKIIVPKARQKKVVEWYHGI